MATTQTATVVDTDQQLDIINFAKNGVGDYLQVNAFAGTGKTTVLEKITKVCPDKKFLYLVFNKAMSDEAKDRFGENTKVCTVNSLAYTFTRDELNLRNVRNNYRVIEIKNHFKIASYDVALMTLKLFDAFCNSNYKDINTSIINNLIKENAELLVILKMKRPNVNDITTYVTKMWNDMYNKKLEITHNFYLKYFHLGIDNFSNKLNYDYILLDEAQDTNAITLDIFNSLQGRKIIVGDKWQQIYGFRGTINAMDTFEQGANQLYLSHTFRFNNKIAGHANYILNNILGEPESIVSHFPNKTKKIESKCWITRTNSGIISIFSKLTNEGYIVKTIRNPDEIFKLPMSLFYFLNDKVKHKDKIEVKWLYNFRSRQDIKEYADEAGDIEMMTSLRIVEEYWDNIVDIFDMAKANRRKKKCDYLITTAHTCKGLQWDEVFIHDDFPDLLLKVAEIAPNIEAFRNKVRGKDTILSTTLQKTIEEFNLYYVAITRTIDTVHLSLPNSNFMGLNDEQLDGILKTNIELLADKTGWKNNGK